MSHDSLKQLYSYSLQLTPISIRFSAAPQGTYALQLHKGKQLLTKVSERVICNANKCTHIFKVPVEHSPTNSCIANPQTIELKLIPTRLGYEWTIYILVKNVLTHFESIPIAITPHLDRYFEEADKHISTICDLHQEQARAQPVFKKWKELTSTFKYKKVSVEAVGVKCTVQFTIQFRDELDSPSDDKGIKLTKLSQIKVIKTVSLDQALPNQDQLESNSPSKSHLVDYQSRPFEVSRQFDTILSEVQQMSNESSVFRWTQTELFKDQDRPISLSINKALLLSKDRNLGESVLLQKVKEETEEREVPKESDRFNSEVIRDSSATISLQKEEEEVEEEGEQSFQQPPISKKQSQELKRKIVVMIIMVLAIIASLIYAIQITTDSYEIDRIRRTRNFK